MKRAVTLFLVVFLTIVPSAASLAQEPPVSVPEAMAEAANVGETGPRLDTGARPFSTDEFIAIVIQDTTVMWATLFQAWELAFVPPTVVTIEQGSYARSSCGVNVGDPQERERLTPILYCQYGGELGTQRVSGSLVYENEFTFEPVIYVSVPWLEAYGRASDAPPDIAVAYRLVHEYTHHIEHVLGYIDHTGGGCCGYTDEQVELWAECLTGVWAYSAYDRGNLAEADIRASQTAAWDISENVPEEFGRHNEYGTPEQRIEAFMLGYEGGDAGACLASGS